MFLADYDFADNIVRFEPMYKKTSNSPFRVNCRCPICGDSAVSDTKARFWIIELQEMDCLWVKCFNCDYSRPFTEFVKDHHPELWPSLLMERRKEQNVFYKPVEKFEPKHAPKKIIEKLNFSERLDKLPESHPIISYVKARKIPKDKWSRLWFTTDWQGLCNSVVPGTYETPKQEYRLVIPIFNKDGEIESFQGRALKKSNAKYVTIKASESSTKIYGQDTVDPNKTVFMFEGPIDSLFIPNSCAITGGTLSLDFVPFPHSRVWVLDNEPRHPDTSKRLEKLIEAGEKVVMWDKLKFTSKDVNDMIVKEGATAEEIEQYMKDNICSGLEAKLRHAKYCKG